MSTEPAPIPVIVVAFPDASAYGDMPAPAPAPDGETEPAPAPTPYRNEHIKSILDKQVLPMVALLPEGTVEPPPLADNPHNQEWYSIIRNTGGLNPVIFRANATDILKAHSNLLVVAVLEFDHKYALAWDLPQMQQ